MSPTQMYLEIIVLYLISCMIFVTLFSVLTSSISDGRVITPVDQMNAK